MLTVHRRSTTGEIVFGSARCQVFTKGARHWQRNSLCYGDVLAGRRSTPAESAERCSKQPQASVLRRKNSEVHAKSFVTIVRCCCHAAVAAAIALENSSRPMRGMAVPLKRDLWTNCLPPATDLWLLHHSHTNRRHRSKSPNLC